MTDQKILKYYLNPEPERKRLGAGYGQLYVKRAKELKAEHWVADRTTENLDERLLTDEPSQQGWILKPADSTASSVPVHQKHPESYHEDSGKACWCWRKKFGGSPPPDWPPF